MDKRGIKPKGKVKINWSTDLAYAIGLIVSDGCLYNDSLHICFTSKDMEQIENFQKCLGIKDIKIGKTFSKDKERFGYRVQFGDVLFFKFLVSIGITPAKSKTIGILKVPDKYFFDFLRGSFDGDGTFYSYWDKRWKSSHMFYLEFISASKEHIDWIRSKLKDKLGIFGHVTKTASGGVFQLKYAKKESLQVIDKMYYNPRVVCLSRKKEKINKALFIERRQQSKY